MKKDNVSPYNIIFELIGGYGKTPAVKALYDDIPRCLNAGRR